ncbi:MAG: glycoside hydrolase domain-containing protein [Stellaceae bacterium]
MPRRAPRQANDAGHDVGNRGNHQAVREVTEPVILAGAIAAATPGTQGFDSDTTIVADTARELCAAGFRFALRYLSRTEPQNPSDLSAAEARAILGAGLALMAVQHCPRPGWAPSAALGRQYGLAAARNATAIGLAPASAGAGLGLSLWLDLEGVASWASAADTIAYCNAWAGAVEAAGFLPGLYVGANQPLSGDELYWRLRIRSYWKSASIVPGIPYRGYQMVQALAPSPVGGVDIDRNVIMADNFGGLPKWLTS